MQSQSATFRKDPPAPHRPPAVHHSFSFPKKSTKSSSSGKPLAPSSAHSSAPLPQEVQPTSKSGESAKKRKHVRQRSSAAYKNKYSLIFLAVFWPCFLKNFLQCGA